MVGYGKVLMEEQVINSSPDDNKITVVNRVAQQPTESEIDLVEVFFTLVHSWRALILGALFGAVLLAAVHVFFIKPSFEASTELYITSNDSMISLQDLQIGTQVAEDYRLIIKSRSVLNQVIEAMQLDMSYDRLNSMVTVTNPNNTHIIKTAVRSGDLALSRDIANELLSVSIERIYQVVGTNEPSVIDYSEANAVEDVSISFSKFVLIGALVGFLLIAVIVIIRMVMNSTIRTEDDVEKYLGMTVLAAIPYFDEKK